ncbi:hybrid signal transduction histidine kinase M [Tanacetum coccineum]
MYSLLGTTSSAPKSIGSEASSRNQTGWNNHERDNRTTTREVCRNFGRGLCRWGDACRFLHDSSRSSGTPRNSNNSTTHRTTQGTLPMHVGSQSVGPISTTASTRLPAGDQTAFSQQHWIFLGTVQGSTPANGQATLLPQAFNTCYSGSNRCKLEHGYLLVGHLILTLMPLILITEAVTEAVMEACDVAAVLYDYLKEEEGELVTPPLKATPKATLIEIVDE